MINCPICLENSKSFVTFECKHNLCLHCFQQCISHNLVKCSMCRKDIPEINNFLKYINNLKTQIEDLEDRLEELWAQIN